LAFVKEMKGNELRQCNYKILNVEIDRETLIAVGGSVNILYCAAMTHNEV